MVPPTIPRVGNLCGGRFQLGELGVLSLGTGVLASWPLPLSNQRGWVTRGRYPVLVIQAAVYLARVYWSVERLSRLAAWHALQRTSSPLEGASGRAMRS